MKKRKKTKIVNRGKQFETQIRKSLENTEEVFVYRLKDTMSFHKGDSNICDFIAYKKPYLYLFECKTTKSKSFPFSNIRENQKEGLLKASKIKGVIAGYLIWFQKDDITIFVKADDLEYWRHQNKDKKSLNPDLLANMNREYLDKWDINKVLPYCIIPGKKKKILFEYDFKHFFS